MEQKPEVIKQEPPKADPPKPAPVVAKKPTQSPMTEEKLIHTLISDAYLITNDPSGSKTGPAKTFLYEFSQDGQ